MFLYYFPKYLKTQLINWFLGRLDWTVSPCLLPQPGYTVGSKLVERCGKSLVVLDWTVKFCPVRLMLLRIGSGWEQSSPNRKCWCLRGNGAEEGLGSTARSFLIVILERAYPLSFENLVTLG